MQSLHFQGGGSGAGEFSQMPDQKAMQVFPDFRVLRAQARSKQGRPIFPGEFLQELAGAGAQGRLGQVRFHAQFVQ